MVITSLQRCDVMAIHVVNPGDTLWSITKLYGVSLQEIAEVNGLLSVDSIIPGLSLYIPTDELTNRLYQVKAGDTLWQLAKSFNTTVVAIINSNKGLDPYRLLIGQKLNIPSPIKPRIETLGFVIPYSPQTILPLLEKLKNQLTYIAVVSYSLTAEGYAYVLLEDREIVARSRQLNIVPLLMIRNYIEGDFSRELIGSVLENPLSRRNLVLSLSNIARERGYGGVSIDFEFIPPPRRNDFNLFLRELKAALGPLILHVNVHAKTQDIPTNPIIGAYDYRTIGNIADKVAVMTIDYGYPTGPPDPIAPIWWLEEVIQYSLTQIRPNKLQMALPLYAYDKVIPTNITRASSVLDAQNFAIVSGAPIQYDTKAQAPWYQYWIDSDQHIVWFEDIRSMVEKYKLIDFYQLSGTTYWQLSLPFPQNWEYVRKQISIIKRS